MGEESTAEAMADTSGPSETIGSGEYAVSTEDLAELGIDSLDKGEEVDISLFSADPREEAGEKITLDKSKAKAKPSKDLEAASKDEDEEPVQDELAARIKKELGIEEEEAKE